MTTATQQILDHIKAHGPKTAGELKSALGLKQGTATSRTSTLAKRGLLTRFGRRYDLAGGVQTKPSTKTHYVLVFDASGSMHNHAQGALALYRGQMDAARDGENEFSLWWFGRGGGVVTNEYSIKKDPPKLYSWPCEGSTPLVDGVCRAAESAEAHGAERNVVLVVTDGCENASEGSGPERIQRIRETLARLQAKGNWTFAFMVPEGYKKEMLAWGVPEGNVTEWANAKAAATLAKASTQSYEAEVKTSGGLVRSSKAYFAPDLSRAALEVGDLREITNEVDAWTTKKEQNIEDVLLERTKQIFVPGTGFFELMKRESRVPGDRKMLIMDRKTGKVFADGKRTIRQVAGLPSGDLALDTGNHAGWVFLIQSKSAKAVTFRARILPRGTRVAYWPGAVK